MTCTCKKQTLYRILQWARKRTSVLTQTPQAAPCVIQLLHFNDLLVVSVVFFWVTSLTCTHLNFSWGRRFALTGEGIRVREEVSSHPLIPSSPSHPRWTSSDDLQLTQSANNCQEHTNKKKCYIWLQSSVIHWTENNNGNTSYVGVKIWTPRAQQ